MKDHVRFITAECSCHHAWTATNQVLRFHWLFTSLTFTLVQLRLYTCCQITDGSQAVTTSLLNISSGPAVLLALFFGPYITRSVGSSLPPAYLYKPFLSEPGYQWLPFSGYSEIIVHRVFKNQVKLHLTVGWIQSTVVLLGTPYKCWVGPLFAFRATSFWSMQTR